MTAAAAAEEPTVEVLLPRKFALGQNYPNPFNPSTTIKYDLPVEGPVRLTIYNVAGRRVRTLVDEHQGAGFKSVVWDGTSDAGQRVSSGLYLYRIESGDYRMTRSMTLVK